MKYLLWVPSFIAAVMIYSYMLGPAQPLKQFTIDGGTFNLNTSIIITSDTAIARRYVSQYRETSSQDFNSLATTFPAQEGQPDIIIWLSSTEDKGVAIHELMHTTSAIMNWAGIPLNDFTEEAYAYELYHLYKQYEKHTN